MRVLLPLSALGLWVTGVAGEILALALMIFSVLGACFWEKEVLDGKHRVAGPVLALLSLNLTLVVADSLLRLTLSETRYPSPHNALFEPSPDYYNRYRYRPNSNLVMRSHGNLVARSTDRSLIQIREIEFVVDRFGFRNYPDKADQKVNILILGDSFAVGSGTTQQQTWPFLLDKNEDFSVYNLGLPGAPSEELYVLKTELPRIRLGEEPTLLWILFAGNDLTDPQMDPDKFGAVRKRGLWSRSHILLAAYQFRSPIREFIRTIGAQLDEELKSSIINFGAFGKSLALASHRELRDKKLLEIKQDGNWPDLFKSIKLGHDFAKEHKLRLVLISAPTKGQVFHRKNGEQSSGFAQAISEIAATLGVAFIDLEPILRHTIGQLSNIHMDPLYWRDDTHWNPEGHKIVAEAIKRELS